jgi:hypothetical protein
MFSVLVRLELDPFLLSRTVATCLLGALLSTLVAAKIGISLFEARKLRQDSREMRHNLADRSCVIFEPVSSLEGLDQVPQL